MCVNRELTQSHFVRTWLGNWHYGISLCRSLLCDHNSGGYSFWCVFRERDCRIDAHFDCPGYVAPTTEAPTTKAVVSTTTEIKIDDDGQATMEESPVTDGKPDTDVEGSGDDGKGKFIDETEKR